MCLPVTHIRLLLLSVSHMTTGRRTVNLYVAFLTQYMFVYEVFIEFLSHVLKHSDGHVNDIRLVFISSKNNALH